MFDKLKAAAQSIKEAGQQSLAGVKEQVGGNDRGPIRGRR